MSLKFSEYVYLKICAFNFFKLDSFFNAKENKFLASKIKLLYSSHRFGNLSSGDVIRSVQSLEPALDQERMFIFDENI